MPYTLEEQAAHREELKDALRSGDYQQGRNALCNVAPAGKQFCCLGVACDISGLGEWGEPLMGSVAYLSSGGDLVGESDVLPHDVADYYGFAFIDGTFEGDDEYERLTEANDCGKTFDEIADMIDEEVALVE